MSGKEIYETFTANPLINVETTTIKDKDNDINRCEESGMKIKQFALIESTSHTFRIVPANRIQRRIVIIYYRRKVTCNVVYSFLAINVQGFRLLQISMTDVWFSGFVLILKTKWNIKSLNDAQSKNYLPKSCINVTDSKRSKWSITIHQTHYIDNAYKKWTEP